MPSPSETMAAAQEALVLLEYNLQRKYPDVANVLSHEPLARYGPGGFHPVALGDTFSDGRYMIRHKLGFGGFSTVWLARDAEKEQWVAIKIKQARVSTNTLEQDPDIRAFKLLEQHCTNINTTGSRCFARLLDYFQHTGLNGIHTCLVSECLGPTFLNVMKIYNDIQVQEILRPDTILRASRQLLSAIATIHQAGITHGDISYSNTAFTCNDALQGDHQYFWNTLGGDPVTAPYEDKEPRPSHLPSQLVSVATWAAWFDSPEEDICLIDWGESFPADEKRSSLAQPVNLRSPETFFVGVFDSRHDLWRVGCVIFYLFFQKSTFGGCDFDAMYVQALIITMGPLPSMWQAKWEEILENSTERFPKGAGFKPLEEVFESRREAIVSNSEESENYEQNDFAEDDYDGLRCLLNVMKGLMQHGPEKRISAQEALSCIQWVDHWKESRSTEEKSLDRED